MKIEIEEHINLITDLADNLLLLAILIGSTKTEVNQSLICPAVHSIAECIKKETASVMDIMYKGP